MNKNRLIPLTILLFALGLTSCASTPSATTSLQSAKTTHTTTLASSSSSWSGNAAGLWDKLQLVSSAKLTEMLNQTQDSTQRAWIQLAIITKQKRASTAKLANDLIAWRQQYPTHPGNALFPNNETLSQLEFSPPPKHIAVLLPQSGPYGALGQSVREGFLHAYYVNRPEVGNQTVKFYDTSQTPNIAALHQQAIEEGADFVIGPLVKENVQQLGNGLSLPTPTLALNYTNQNLRRGNLYEFGLLPEDEAGQLADRAHEAGLSRALVIAPQNTWGQRLVSAFSARWQATGGSVQASWYYSDKEKFNTDVANLLKVDLSRDKQLMRKDNRKDILEQQRRQDFDVVFLFSQPQEARLIVPLLRYYYLGNVPIYTTSSTYSGKPNPEKDADLNGIIVCDIPWNLSSKMYAHSNTVASERLYALGQDAYMLSQSLQRLQNLPHFPLYGTTGALRLSDQRQIHRRLPCVAIRNGRL